MPTAKTQSIITQYNTLQSHELPDNYFSHSFGGKFFSHKSARIIGHIRNDIERKKSYLNHKEYNILLASLLYSVDKIANTVGHYDAYFKKDNVHDSFFLYGIRPLSLASGEKQSISIFREDANQLAYRIQSDVIYIDPPYNSRQYSRFYHVLETLTKWDNPQLFGVARKPKAENMSDYCRVQAKTQLADLIQHINAKYIVLSYNNTYTPKSNSSLNKISLADIKTMFEEQGQTKIFEQSYRHFNAGNSHFHNHKEYLFVCRVRKRISL